jgi:hypothetical protein
MNGDYGALRLWSTVLMFIGILGVIFVVIGVIFAVLQRQSKALSRMRSWTRLPAVSSNIVGTVCRFNCYDGRCRAEPARSFRRSS